MTAHMKTIFNLNEPWCHTEIEYVVRLSVAQHWARLIPEMKALQKLKTCHRGRQ